MQVASAPGRSWARGEPGPGARRTTPRRTERTARAGGIASTWEHSRRESQAGRANQQALSVVRSLRERFASKGPHASGVRATRATDFLKNLYKIAAQRAAT